MTLQQLSVFLENKIGHLNQALAVLAQKNINIIALTIADTSDYGLARMVVSDPVLGKAALRDAGFSASLNEVLSIELGTGPGEMAKVLDLFTAERICIEYVYAFNFGSKAVMVMRPEKPENALEVAHKHQLNTIKEEELKKGGCHDLE